MAYTVRDVRNAHRDDDHRASPLVLCIAASGRHHLTYTSQVPALHEADAMRVMS